MKNSNQLTSAQIKELLSQFFTTRKPLSERIYPEVKELKSSLGFEKFAMLHYNYTKALKENIGLGSEFEPEDKTVSISIINSRLESLSSEKDKCDTQIIKHSNEITLIESMLNEKKSTLLQLNDKINSLIHEQKLLNSELLAHAAHCNSSVETLDGLVNSLLESINIDLDESFSTPIGNDDISNGFNKSHQDDAVIDDMICKSIEEIESHEQLVDEAITNIDCNSSDSDKIKNELKAPIAEGSRFNIAVDIAEQYQSEFEWMVEHADEILEAQEADRIRMMEQAELIMETQEDEQLRMIENAVDTMEQQEEEFIRMVDEVEEAADWHLQELSRMADEVEEAAQWELEELSRRADEIEEEANRQEEEMLRKFSEIEDAASFGPGFRRK